MKRISLTDNKKLPLSKYRKAWVNFINEQGFTHGLTLQWNYAITRDQLIADIKHIHGAVDRYLLGPRFHKKPNRSQALFILEGEERLNLHCHSLWRMDTANHYEEFESLFPLRRKKCGLFTRISEKGTYRLIRNDEHNGFGAAAAVYDTKKFHRKATDNLFFSSDFTQPLPIIGQSTPPLAN